MAKNVRDMLSDPDFQALSRKKNSISLILTVLELLLYFGFIALIAFTKPFLGARVYGAITIGIPIAVGTIALSWVLTGIYVKWANARYDALVNKVRGGK